MTRRLYKKKGKREQLVPSLGSVSRASRREKRNRERADADGLDRLDLEQKGKKKIDGCRGIPGRKEEKETPPPLVFLSSQQKGKEKKKRKKKKRLAAHIATRQPAARGKPGGEGGQLIFDWFSRTES